MVFWWGSEPRDVAYWQPGDWFTPAEAASRLRPLLAEIGRVYVPFLTANAEALMAGKESFETEIDGMPWRQPTFPYQAKCLKHLRDTAATLPEDTRAALRKVFSGTGCDALLG